MDWCPTKCESSSSATLQCSARYEPHLRPHRPPCQLYRQTIRYQLTAPMPLSSVLGVVRSTQSSTKQDTVQCSRWNVEIYDRLILLYLSELNVCTCSVGCILIKSNPTLFHKFLYIKHRLPSVPFLQTQKIIQTESEIPVRKVAYKCWITLMGMVNSMSTCMGMGEYSSQWIGDEVE